MYRTSCTRWAMAGLVLLACGASPTLAQINDAWVVFQDSLTGAECGVINAANAELVTLFDSGTMVVITGADVRLNDLIVNVYDEVFYQGEQAGVIAFFDDADGLPAVFWTTLTGTVMQINTLTGQPSDSFLLPEEISATGCDACELIEESIFCGVENGAGNDTPSSSLGEILPFQCGAGAAGAAVVGTLLLPLVAFRSKQRVVASGCFARRRR